MSLTTSTVTPLVLQTPLNPNFPDYITVINPDGSISYEPNLHYQQPTIIRRTYAKSSKRKHNYSLGQEGKSYRCCECCHRWCTRKCPTLDFCDRILACPLLFYILAGLLLLLLLIALLTLFGLDPNINRTNRYYGIISTLSISNMTEYVYGLDAPCFEYSILGSPLCINLTTSTSVVRAATTIVISQAASIHNYSYAFFILLCLCLTIYYTHRRSTSI